MTQLTLVPAAQIVDWLPSASVDLTGEPGSLVQLEPARGHVLMVLAQTDAACRFLANDERCTVYGARPGNCVLYPFVASYGARGGLRRLRLLSDSRCEHGRDGQNDPHLLREADRLRWAEYQRFQLEISAWNRAQRHRARLGHRLQKGEEFLDFLGFPEPTSESALTRGETARL